MATKRILKRIVKVTQPPTKRMVRSANRTPATAQNKRKPTTLRSIEIGIPLDFGHGYPVGILFETKEEKIVTAEIELLNGTIMIDKWQSLKTEVDVKCNPLTKPICATQLWALEFKRVIKTDAEAVHALYRGIKEED